MGRKWCGVQELLDYNWQVLSLPLPESFQDQSSGYLLRVLKGLTFCGLCFFSRAGKKQSLQKLGTLIFQRISPQCLGLSFFSELKGLDYSRTNFLLFAGARVLDTH